MDIGILALAVTIIGVAVTAVGVVHQLRTAPNAARSTRGTRLKRSTARRIFARGSPANSQPHEILMDICSKCVLQSPKGKYNAGLFSNVYVDVFIDMSTACITIETREDLADVLGEEIRRLESKLGLVFDCIATPKEGNVLLETRPQGC